MLAAFAVVVFGFWPSFFRPMSGGSTLRTVHGITSSLWYVALILQAVLIKYGYVRWHRRVAVIVVALLPAVCVSALMTTRVMLTTSAQTPPFARPIVAWIDVGTVALFVALFFLGLQNRRIPAAHMRYMASTSLVGFVPANARGLAHIFPALDPFISVNLNFFLIELLLAILIVVDWRAGERKRRAYPIALVAYISIHVFIYVVPDTGWWLAFCRWFAAGPT